MNITRSALALTLITGFLHAQSQSAAILIAGARIADGTGAPLRQADVRIQGDRIVEIGKLKSHPGEQAIDAKGLVLAPGFIDLHNHSQALDKDPGAASQVSQGITTVLLGQDGGSPWPLSDYLTQRREHPAALNLQSMVGHATVRRKVMGDDYRRVATPDEIEKMVRLVDEAMRQGAVGLSSGLEYEVGSYSATEEVIAMARAAAKHGGIYVSHIRDEADLSLQSIHEAIRIGAEADIPVEISHIKLGTVSVWGKAPEVVKLVDAARSRGVKIAADCYPYDAWSSTITVLVPDKKYDNPASVKKALDDVGGGANITITHCAKHPDYELHSLEEIAKLHDTDPVSLYIQIVKDGGAGVVCHAMKDEDIRTFYQTPWVMVGSDGGIGMRHPRGSGTYPRVLGLYVRERHWLTLPAAIQKMTSLPAQTLKLKDRGVIRKGAFADLVLFNPATVIDRSTFADPLTLSTGIEKVFVNGGLVWDGGKTTGQYPGRVLD
ncbi:MAG: N-acyl-D-amino-acid deacylase family protein [Bryobacteraceae bacterium]